MVDNTDNKVTTPSQSIKQEERLDGNKWMLVFPLLMLVPFYSYYWIYKTTKLLNADTSSKKSTPIIQLILCMFVPLYFIFWSYAQIKKMDNLAKKWLNKYMEIKSKWLICIILQVVFPVIISIITVLLTFVISDIQAVLMVQSIGIAIMIIGSLILYFVPVCLMQARMNALSKLPTYQQRQDRSGYTFMSAWIIGFAIFTLFPFIMTIYLSFTNVKSTIMGYEIHWIGLDNYYTAFFQNESFLPAMISYLRMIIPYTFIVVVLAFIIAYLLNKINVGKSLLRTIYFLPVIIMSGPVMSQLLSVQDTASTAVVHGEAVNPYANIFIMQMIQSYSPALGMFLAEIFSQLSIILWFTGIPIVLFINGLQKINPSIYEAAKIDSANAWQIMWKITIPMLKQTGLIITVFTIIQLGMYDSINPVYKLIQDATNDTNGGLGFAATYAWIYSFVALLIVGVAFLLFMDRKPKDIKERQKQEKKLAKLEKQQRRRLASQRRHQKKEAKLYGK